MHSYQDIRVLDDLQLSLERDGSKVVTLYSHMRIFRSKLSQKCLTVHESPVTSTVDERQHNLGALARLDAGQPIETQHTTRKRSQESRAFTSMNRPVALPEWIAATRQ